MDLCELEIGLCSFYFIIIDLLCCSMDDLESDSLIVDTA